MRRNGWWMLLAGVVGGILGVILGRGWEAVPAWGQHLARFQNVEVDFETTGTVSTLVFFDRDSGALYFYAATANGPFQFARSVRLQELGGPLQATSAATPLCTNNPPGSSTPLRPGDGYAGGAHRSPNRTPRDGLQAVRPQRGYP
ncbi:MAG: hypothetical protein KatS3mg115_1352 [Candidatus Poribacteria bacterium]|nr:MAG: hypothetical protein KatS3mg115_1352 [Candidatus Poribacteria bacterium]